MSGDKGGDGDGDDNNNSEPLAPTHLKSVKGDTPPITLSPKHKDDLESSGLTNETIALAGIYSEGKSAPIAEILGWPWRNGGAMVLPFIDYDSRKVLCCRVKPDKPRQKKGAKSKPVKYEQAPGTGAVPYIGPRTITERRLEASSHIVYWAEGEKKTLLLDQLGLCAIGLTGCHNFNDGEKNRNGDGIVWAPKLAKYAQRFVAGRHHVIIYDSDAFSNEHVMLAMRRLAGLLLATGALSTKYIRIPADVNDPSKGIGIDDYFVEQGEEKTRAIIAAAETIAIGEDVEPIPPKDPLVRLASVPALKSAKLDSDLRLPPQFEIRRDRSLWLQPPADKADADALEVMTNVIIPTHLHFEAGGEGERLAFVYFARGDWRKGVVERKAARDARRALSEFPPGVSIDSNNAPAVVKWFTEYMRHNEKRMRARKYVSQCGWQEVDGETVFLLDKPITALEDGEAIVADDSGSGITAALAPKGDKDKQLKALKAAFNEDPVAAIVILASLAAPLLKPLNAPNFAVHLPGDSSRGKTSMLKIAASIYGDPCNSQWVGSWNSTPTAMEVRAATLNDLPLPFDEAGAGDARIIEKNLYMLINGAGKSRGNRDLRVSAPLSFRNVTISTGEHEIATEQANTGAQIRVLQFRVSRFGSLDAAGVDSLRSICEHHYGWVGRQWIDALVTTDDWTEVYKAFAVAKRSYRHKAPNELAQRQAVYFALLAVTESLASDVLGIGDSKGITVQRMFSSDGFESIDSAADRALEVVSDWIASEPTCFPSLVLGTAGGLVTKSQSNVRKVYGVRHDSVVAFVPTELKTKLHSSGFSYKEVIASWLQSDFLRTGGGRNTLRLRFNGAQARMIALKCSVLDSDASDAQPNVTEEHSNAEDGDFVSSQRESEQTKS